MSATGSLSTAVSAVTDHPGPLLAVGFVLSVLGQVAAFLQYVGSPGLTLGVLVLLLLLQVALFGGLVALADGALDGRASLDRFRSAARENYVSLLGAGLLLFGILFAVGVVGFVVLLVAGIAAGGAAASAGGGMAAAGVIAVVFALVFALLVLAVFFFVQFVPEAVVLDDAGVVDAYSRSVSLVRSNFLSAAGFTVIYAVLSMALTAPGQVLLTLGLEFPTETGAATAQIGSPSLYAAGALLSVVLGTVSVALLWTYHVAFYRSIADDGRTGSDETAATVGHAGA